jgi:sugar (pentulose or hexulose) kinase
MEYALAVIDIGMTNKKVAVYDVALRQLDAQYRGFEPKIIDGLPCHDLDAMEDWFTGQLQQYAAKYPVKALAISAHGATFVCVGSDGKSVLPCVYYTHEPGKDFHQRFYERFGSIEDLQARTGTPAFEALINPAKGILFAMERFPEAFRKTVRILPYPQYWGFRFTGTAAAESTYMGCHTYLWDHLDQRLSSVARDLGIAPLLPDTLNRSPDTLGRISDEFAAKTGLSGGTIVTMGIHDSNSSLLPHFAKQGGRQFTLNSTGTWCVIMKAADKYGFAPDELGKAVFFNISAFGSPVKTAIFLGGQEFEKWSRLIQKRHERTDIPGWNEALYRAVLTGKTGFLLPELTPGSGQFPHSRARVVSNGNNYFFESLHNSDCPLPPCFLDYEQAFALLRLSLVMQTLTALERTGLEPGQPVYTEGGFRRDESYSRLLASALKDNGVFLTGIAEATALGAAMTAKMAISGKSLADLADDFSIEYIEQEKSELAGLLEYRKAWLAEAENHTY